MREAIMFKSDLYDQINEARQRKNLAPISREEFVAALSSLEAKGLIASLGEECWIMPPDTVVEIIEGG